MNRIRPRPLILNLVAAVALGGAVVGEEAIYPNDFEAGGLCPAAWSDVANPESCNGADDDCDGFIDELLVDCPTCAPPAAVEEALEGVEFGFCIPEIEVARELVTATVCGESSCNGEPGCAVSGAITQAVVDPVSGEITLTVAVDDALFDVRVAITTPPAEGGCDLAVSDVSSSVEVLFSTTPVSAGIEEIADITAVDATTTFDLALQSCGTVQFQNAANLVLDLIETAVGEAFDTQLAETLELVLEEYLVGVPLCTG